MATPSLPGNPPPLLADIVNRMAPAERNAFIPHLLGATSAEWLADTLTIWDYPISPTTIRTYRRSLSERPD